MTYSDYFEKGKEPSFLQRPKHELECTTCGTIMRISAVDERDFEGNFCINGIEYTCSNCVKKSHKLCA